MRTKAVFPVFALLVLLSLSVAVEATPISYQSAGGTITSNGSVLALGHSPLSGGGSLSFSTGPLKAGSLATSAILGAGGSVQISAASVLFSGLFSAPPTWTARWVSTAGPNGQGAWYYTLSAAVRGTLSNGQSVFGNLNILTRDVPHSRDFESFVNVSQGMLTLSVPEPGSVTLLGFGIMWVAAVVRRRSV